MSCTLPEILKLSVCTWKWMVGIRVFRFGMCLFSGVMLVLRSVCFLVNMFMALAMERAPMYLFHYGSPSNVTWLNHTHAVSTTQTSANWKFLISSSTEPIEKHLWIFSRQLLLMDQLIWPLWSTYGIFTYMYHKNQPFMWVNIPFPWMRHGWCQLPHKLQHFMPLYVGVSQSLPGAGPY